MSTKYFLVLCMVWCSISEARIHRPIHVYYETYKPDHRPGKPEIEYGRFTALIANGTNTDVLAKMKSSKEALMWAAEHAYEVGNHFVYKTQQEMIKAMKLDESSSLTFYSPGVKLQGRLSRRRRQVLEHKYPKVLNRTERRGTQVSYNNHRDKRFLQVLLNPVVIDIIWAGLGTSVLFCAIYIPTVDYNTPHSAGYLLATGILDKKRPPTKSETSLFNLVKFNEEYERNLTFALAVERTTFNAYHNRSGRGQQRKSKVQQVSRGQSSDAAVSYSWRYASNKGNFLASSGNNGPPTQPPRPPTKPTPLPALVILDDEEDNNDKEDNDDILVLELSKKGSKRPCPPPQCSSNKKIKTSVAANQEIEVINLDDSFDADVLEMPAAAPVAAAAPIAAAAPANPVFAVLSSSSSESESTQMERQEELQNHIRDNQFQLNFGDQFILVTWDIPAHLEDVHYQERPRNIADQREAHPISGSTYEHMSWPLDTEINIPVEQGRQTMIRATVSYPASALSPQHRRQVEYNLRTVDLPSYRQGRDTLSQWIGLTWYTPSVMNSCNMDSFFTYMLLRSRMQPDFAQRYFLIPGNVAEASLRAGLAMFNDQQRWTSSQAYVNMNDEFKRMYLSANFQRHRENLNREGRTNVVGGEMGNVYDVFRDSTRITATTVCQCLDQHGRNEIHVEDLATGVNRWRLEDLQALAGGNQASGTNSRRHRTCTACGNARRFQFFYVPDTTWYLRFATLPSVREGTGGFLVFDVNQLPSTLEINEALRPGQVATFDLAYVSLSTVAPPGSGPNHVTHMTSLMRFNGQWWYYNDMERDGRLLLVSDPNGLIRRLRLSISGISYFRR